MISLYLDDNILKGAKFLRILILMKEIYLSLNFLWSHSISNTDLYLSLTHSITCVSHMFTEIPDDRLSSLNYVTQNMYDIILRHIIIRILSLSKIICFIMLHDVYTVNKTMMCFRYDWLPIIFLIDYLYS